MTLLRALPREANNDFLFISSRKPGGSIGENALLKALRALRADGTVHGFRSSFRVWAAERTSYPEVVAEQALAHEVADATVRAYRRTDLFDRRKKLMAQWAAYCEAPADTAAGVVSLRARL